jgi:hypothetical protein
MKVWPSATRLHFSGSGHRRRRFPVLQHTAQGPGNNWLVLRFDNKINYVLARRLLAQYMSRPYEFFLNRNTAELGKNILTEARNVVIGVVSPIGELVSRGLIALAIMGLLIAVDPLSPC